MRQTSLPRKRTLLATTASLALVVASVASAGTAAPPEICQAAKQRMAGSYARCIARAEALATLTQGRAETMACDAALSRSFETIEAWGLPCPLAGDLALQRTALRRCLDATVETVHGTASALGDTANCDSKRIRAAGRYLQCVQRHAAFTSEGLSFLAPPLDRCRTKLDRAVGLAAFAGDCSAADPSASLAKRLDACTAALDPQLTTYTGVVSVITRHPDGHPREVGVAVERTLDSVWTVDGLETIYFGEGELARALADDEGRPARVRGTVQLGIEFLRTLHLQSYELEDEAAVAPLPEAATRDVQIVGTVQVYDRFEDGHPKTLAVAPESGMEHVLVTTNKSQELRYRIGHRVRIDGTREADERVRVTAYEDLENNPIVAPGDGFRVSYLAGGEDENGRLMGGVEVDALIAFDGKIFAGTSMRRNTQEESPDPEVSSQILVLDRPDGRWRVDFEAPIDEGSDSPRIVFLDVVRFATDARGEPLDEPVSFLAAVSGGGEIYLRPAGDEAPWVATGLLPVVRAAAGPRGKTDARSVVSHDDRITGVSHLFAGAGVGRSGAGGGIYRGSYDPALPELVRWEPQAEYAIPDARPNPRVMGLTEVAGSAYASLGTLLLRREDGPQPSWVEVFRDVREAGNDSIRRAIGIEGPNGEDSLLFGIEGPNCRTVSIDVDDADAATEEVFLHREIPGGYYGAVAYNGPTQRRLDDGSTATILGAMVFRPLRGVGDDIGPDLGRVYNFTDGMFLWRDSDGAYFWNRIHDRTLEVHPPLVGVRSVLAHSPFAGEENVLYFSGFDHNRHLWHNTGWIFKARLEDIRAGLAPFRDLASQAPIEVDHAD